MKPYALGLLILILSNMFFGLNDAMGPMAMWFGTTACAVSFLSRFLAMFMMFAALLVKRTPLRMSRRSVRMVIALGFANAVTNLALATSISMLGAGMATMLHMLHVVITAVGEALLLHKRLNKMTIAAMVVLMMGLALMLGGNILSFSILGVTLALFSGISYAMMMLLMGHTSLKDEHPQVTVFYSTAVAAALLGAYGGTTGQLALGTITWQGWTLNLCNAFIGGYLAMLLLQSGIRKAGSTLASLLGALEPFTSTLLGVLLLGETFTPAMVVGGVLILLGMLLEPATILINEKKMTTATLKR